MHTIRFEANGRWTATPPQAQQGGAGEGQGQGDAEGRPAGAPESEPTGASATDASEPAVATPAAAGPTPEAPAAAPGEPAPGATAAQEGSADLPEVSVPERDLLAIEKDCIKALQTVYDPEIPVDIYQLGLIYGVHVDEEQRVRVTMTLTSPACFAAQVLPGEVKRKAESVEGVRSAKVDVVWDPQWNPSMMSEAARLALNMMW